MFFFLSLFFFCFLLLVFNILAFRMQVCHEVQISTKGFHGVVTILFTLVLIFTYSLFYLTKCLISKVYTDVIVKLNRLFVCVYLTLIMLMHNVYLHFFSYVVCRWQMLKHYIISAGFQLLSH